MMSTTSRRSPRLLHAVDEKAWWRVTERGPYATFNHTPAWQTLVLEAFPDLQPATLAAECPNGTLAILPLIRTGNATNRARKAGVRVRETRAEEDYCRYYRLHRDTLEVTPAAAG